MKEIKITPPEGYEVDKENSTFDCIKFKPVEKKILTWYEIQKTNAGKIQFYIDTVGDIAEYHIHQNECWSVLRSNAHTKRIAEKVRALCQLYIIAEWYNEGWVADFFNIDQPKYYASWINGQERIYISSVTSYSFNTPFFKSIEALRLAYESNKEIFETALKP